MLVRLLVYSSSTLQQAKSSRICRPSAADYLYHLVNAIVSPTDQPVFSSNMMKVFPDNFERLLPSFNATFFK